LEETKKFLEFQPVGTFLMRFSSSKPGSFALAFTSAPRSVTHVIIKTAPPRGFSIQEENSEKYFEHVSQIVNYYSSVLTRPFDSALPEEQYACFFFFFKSSFYYLLFFFFSSYFLLKCFDKIIIDGFMEILRHLKQNNF